MCEIGTGKRELSEIGTGKRELCEIGTSKRELCEIGTGKREMSEIGTNKMILMDTMILCRSVDTKTGTVTSHCTLWCETFFSPLVQGSVLVSFIVLQ